MQGRKIITIISAVLCVSMVISFLLVGCSNGLSSQTTGKEAASETTGKEAAPETTATSGQSIPTPQWSPGSSTEFKKQIQDYLAANKLTTVKIGFSAPIMSEYWNEIHAGAFTMMKQLNDEYGIKWDYTISAPSTLEKVEEQVDMIKNWSRQGFQAVVVGTVGDISAMDTTFGELLKNNTYSYFYNMPPRYNFQQADSPLSDLTMNTRANIGYDNYLAHYNAGLWFAKLLTLKYGEPKGTIGQIWGPVCHWSIDRNNGFVAAMKLFPNIKVVDMVRGDYERASGMRAAEDLLSRNPDLDILYGENEEMGLGAAEAALARGLKIWDWEKKDGIIVLGADGLVTGYDEIKADRLTGTIDVNPVQNGRNIIEAIFWDRVMGWQIDKIINNPTDIADKTDVGLHEAYVKWALATEYPSGGY